MKKTFYFLAILFLCSCSNDKDDCIIITEKRNFEGQFYFLFQNENNFQQNNQNPNNTGGTFFDPNASGSVSEEVYNSYGVGDEYCY